MKKPKTLALIPARENSKRLPGKNLKNFWGKPLIQWTIEIAKQVSDFDRVVVSSDHLAILELGKSLNCETSKRSPNLALDQTSMFDLMSHYLDLWNDVNLFVILQPTSPLRSLEDVLHGMELLKKEDSVLSLTELIKDESWIWTTDPNHRLVNQEKGAKMLSPNGAFFGFKRSWILENRKIYAGGSKGFLMPEQRSIDIDTQEDFDLAANLAKLQPERFKL